MRLEELIQVLQTEESAEAFLREKGILKTFTKCIVCQNPHIGKVRRNFYRCHRCKKEWSTRKGSVLEYAKVSFRQFLLIMKLFLLEVPVNQAYKEVGLTYRTVHKAYHLLRKSIYQSIQKQETVLEGEIEMDEAYFGGRRKGNRGRGAHKKIPVFGILERNGRVSVEIVEDVTAERLLKESIKKVKRGSLIYTDKFKSYDGLVMYGFRHERLDKSKRF
ncbi:MAG: IS1595 family transposase, partial [Spirochaetes bacterium]|nr:IS1595 family transposase [Spirochaetota bacterium]